MVNLLSEKCWTSLRGTTLRSRCRSRTRVRLLRWKNDGFKPKAYARGWPALATRLFSRRCPRFTFQTAMKMQAGILAARRARALSHSSPSHEAEGAGKAGCRLHPWAPCNKKSTGVGPQVNRSNAGFPCAVVYGLLRALPGDRALLPPSPLRSSLPRSLTPASGRQDHTTSPSAMSGVRRSPSSRPPHPTATFVTCATPLLSGETGQADISDLPDALSGIFLREGMDRLLVTVGLLCRSGGNRI
jgi:hypothetical protein